MEWKDKIMLSGLLENRKYSEAVKLMKDNEDSMDAQSVSIFISGFSLVHHELLLPILPILKKYIDYDGISWRCRMRLALAIKLCKELKEE